MRVFEQAGFEVKFAWGGHGARRLAAVSSVVVLVDVLSFTTAVEMACSRGAIVYPHRFRDSSVKDFATSLGAHLAVPREEVSTEHPFSLSPASMQRLTPGDRLVLPSPNGATLSLLLSQQTPRLLAGCLRNAHAVAQRALSAGGVISVIAAGERWEEDQSLRPAYEDLLGAGSILSSLVGLLLSPEARAAVAVFEDAVSTIEARLLECESGQELQARGFIEDVLLAAELNQSAVVPVFGNGMFEGS
jgi:2-phosphosulfolactate phosphatase